MNDYLTPNQQELARKIIFKGMEKAAESLSFFMQETITVKNLCDPTCSNCEPLNISDKGENNIHVMTTKILGELSGVCCLIFSEEEANLLRTTALPAEILNSPEMMAEMSDGIMLEVDNIISASVITQFSNLLKSKIHGSVPSINKLTKVELTDYIKHELDLGFHVISFKSEFSSSHLNFSPEFLWLFEKSFLDKIIEHAEEIN